jgi:hypothetical protein
MAEELRVPTQSVRAEILLVDGKRLKGEIFIPAATTDYAGSRGVEDWIEELEEFFPFHTEGAAKPALYAKEAIVALTTTAPEGGAEEIDTPASDAFPHHHVVLECAASRHEGTLSIEMPAHQRRVLDCMNHHERFVCLRNGNRLQLVRKRAVLRVIEP